MVGPADPGRRVQPERDRYRTVGTPFRLACGSCPPGLNGVTKPLPSEPQSATLPDLARSDPDVFSASVVECGTRREADGEPYSLHAFCGVSESACSDQHTKVAQQGLGREQVGSANLPTQLPEGHLERGG